jgi:glutathione synthase
VVRAQDRRNLPQILRAVRREGYVVAQTLLPSALEHDVRLFLVDGEPLRVRGRLAAVSRVRTGEDLRTNVHAGGQPRAAVVDDSILELAAKLRPRLVADGMFFVGVDIAGDKVMELNVFNPGGLPDASRIERVNFVRGLREALERRVAARG